MTIIYDTLKLSKILQTTFSTEQSDAIANAFADCTQDTIATTTVLQTLSADIAVKLADLRSDMVRWIVGAIAFNLLGTVGIMVTVAKLVAR